LLLVKIKRDEFAIKLIVITLEISVTKIPSREGGES